MTPRILMCDDEPHIALAVSMKFKNAGFDVRTARDGEDAWEQLREFAPELLITDCTMPRLDGLELCRRIRRHPELAGIPIFMLTARGLELDSEMLSGELGISRIILKPFSPRELLRDVQHTLGLVPAPPRAECITSSSP